MAAATNTNRKTDLYNKAVAIYCGGLFFAT
jgi:hypothetical protein